MKIKQGFVLRKVMGNAVVIAVGEASRSFRGMVQLNSTAADIWELIEKGCSELEICDAICEKFEVSREVAEQDVKKTLDMLSAQGIIEL